MTTGEELAGENNYFGSEKEDKQFLRPFERDLMKKAVVYQCCKKL